MADLPERLTEARLAEFEAPGFWDQFQRGVLSKEKRPTPTEAVLYIRHLESEVRTWQACARCEKASTKLTEHAFESFVSDVMALALKHRPS